MRRDRSTVLIALLLVVAAYCGSAQQQNTVSETGDGRTELTGQEGGTGGGEVRVEVEAPTHPSDAARANEEEAAVVPEDVNEGAGEETNAETAPTRTEKLLFDPDALLNDFLGIGFISNANSSNVVGALDTGVCRTYSLGDLVSGSDSRSTWEQRACVERNYRFAQAHGGDVDMVFLGEDLTKRWVTDASDVWEWMSERVARGSVANLGCEGIDTNATLYGTRRMVERTAVSPKVWILSLGLNDCMRGDSYHDIARRVQEVVKTLRFYNCYSHVALAAILPTTPDDGEYSWDASPQRACIQYTNALLKRFVAKNSNSGVSFVDCGDKFLSTRGDKLDRLLLPNGLHLSHAGYIKYAACLGQHVVRYSAIRRSKYPAEFNFSVAPRPNPEKSATKYDWKYSAWGDCSVACGAGDQTRTAVCADSDGATVSDDKCEVRDLALVRPCANRPCELFSYVAGPWGQCSASCGRGVAKRSVSCVSSTTGRMAESESACEAASKPATAMECNAQPCDLPCGSRGSCSGSGKCSTDNKCICDRGFEGEWCHIAPDCASGVPSKSGCCPSALVAADGTCAPSGAVIDRYGEACASGTLDICGVCNGQADAVDVFGQCCEGELDAAGVCCNPDNIDECGVCGGASNTCALTGQISVAAASYTELDVLMQADFKLSLSEGLDRFGVTPDLLSVTSVTLTPGEDTAEVELVVSPPTQPGIAGGLTVKGFEDALDSDESPASAVVLSIRGVERAGVCGNGVCEVGEQRVGDVPGACPADCPISFNACPTTDGSIATCSGHGLCTPMNGVCDCFPGYTGDGCEQCAGGYERVGDICATYVGVSGGTVGGHTNAVTKDSGALFSTVAAVLLGVVCFLTVATLGMGVYHCLYVRNVRRMQSLAAASLNPECINPMRSTPNTKI